MNILIFEEVLKLKKILTILMVFTLAFALAACGGGGTTPPPPPPANGGGDAADPIDDGQVFHITAAHSHVEALSVHNFFVFFQEEIERLGGGRITMDLFSGGVLGGDADLTTAVLAGDVTMMGANINPHSMFMPDLAVFDIQFIHNNLDQARGVLNDPELMARVRGIYEDYGLHLLGFTDSSFRYITANFPIRTPQDMAGLTLRASANVFHVANWEAIGANPTPLPIGEVYVALQQGTVDAQDNPIEHNLLFLFYEQQTHFMETNHLFHVNTFVMNPDFYNGLPADLQAAVDEAAANALRRTQERHDSELQGNLDYLAGQGIILETFTPADLEPFRALVSAGAWPVVEDAVSAETYRIFMEAVERSRN